MDKRLENALSFANYRQTLNTQLQKLKIRTEGALILSKNGGNFSIDRELICFIDFLIRDGLNSAILLDDNKSPIQIDDLKTFLSEVTTRYSSVTNDYLKEYQEIRKSRNVKSIIKIEDKE